MRIEVMSVDIAFYIYKGILEKYKAAGLYQEFIFSELPEN